MAGTKHTAGGSTREKIQIGYLSGEEPCECGETTVKECDDCCVPKSSAHTPGPWMAAQRPSSTAGLPIVSTATGRSIAGVTFYSVGKGFEQHDRESAANALLIAAAPDLLAELKAMTDHYVKLASSGDCGFWNADAEPIVMRARAAIAKAGGSSHD